MGDLRTNFDKPLSTVSGQIFGSNLLDVLKAAMIQQKVFQAIFGTKGERIFVKDVPSYNDTVVPAMELYWVGDTYDNWDTYLTGSITGRIVLPVQLRGDFNRLRQIAAVFARFLGSKTFDPYSSVYGLIEFGNGIQFKYDQMLKVDALFFPVIPFTMPVKFDLQLYSQQNPEVDVLGNLDAALIGWVETYQMQVNSDDGVVLNPLGTLEVTGQTN
jgi:hypothetical protein